MTSTNETQGFFSTNGVLRSDSVSSTSTPSKAQSSSDSTTTVEQKASEITDAAVYTVSTQLNVGSTGYDSGVAQLVQSAVSSGLQKQQSTPSASSGGIPPFVGGTYQNEILANAKSGTTQPTPAPAVPAPPVSPQTDPPSDSVNGTVKHSHSHSHGADKSPRANDGDGNGGKKIESKKTDKGSSGHANSDHRKHSVDAEA